ncbi:phosphoribosylformylglycinamidine synthase I [Flavipsychrobacter stenotrophus]|uniref:Phosphoribosylformylglycinamidine synthase subunit PurQ n=1 Tax=Flavipsychrobacter stenotrophus TaxID=2077091 RepID=A0A2S7T185_9BACT|nr:phosphoribosylformylglycinamidine synthase subunit PurQ [Flavipsychrobacter stenotrophus]PQJ12575.1 phosphoribosylformylglycinamidine synthase I [Flavipsychrobacter stenotrophus]
MKFGIIVFPGSNCDRDMMHALRDDLKQEVVMLWHKDRDLSMFTKDDCIVLPGGFSYGDYLRCGALARFSPMMEQVIEFANNGGKVLGVCNGFQILCEAGLLPGVLLQNDHQKFTCKNVYIKGESTENLIGGHVGNKALRIPVAHGEGRYHADAETLKKLQDNKQIVFRYCDEHGEVHINSNPNGAINNIAGICNEGRNVFGMMPHPERATSDVLNNIDGRAILEALTHMN